MTSVLGTGAPDVDPLEAARLCDLGMDFLIDRELACVATPYPMPGSNKPLAGDLAALRTADDLLATAGRHMRSAAQMQRSPEWTELAALLPPAGTPAAALPDALQPWFDAVAARARARLGDKPYHQDVSFLLQLGTITRHLNALAYVRQGVRRLLDPRAPVPLAGPLVPAPGRPTEGAGPVDVFEIVEPTHPFCWQGHADARAMLGPAAAHVRWHWVHGVSHEHARTLAGVCLVEAALEQDARLWQGGPALLRQVMALRLGHFEEALRAARWPADPARAAARAGSDEIKARVQRDLSLIDAVGVPEVRPAFAVGRRILAGRDAPAALAAAVMEHLPR